MTGRPDVVTARHAAEADAPVIDSLASIARDEALAQRGGEMLLSFDRPGRRPPSSAGTDEAVLVGEVDGVVVGYAWLHVDREGSIVTAMLDELFVHPEARDVGVAAAMLAQAQAYARSSGCTHVESEVLPGNRAAKNFFERMGMKTRKMRVSAPLDAAD